MFKVFATLLAGLVGAAIVHICVVFAMPALASNNSWGRLGQLGPMFGVVRIDPQRTQATGGDDGGSGRRAFAFVDPAFVTASCRFDLEDGPVRLTSDAPASFWSASIYTRRGDNVYSINDRSSVGGRFDLLVGSSEQLVDTKATSPDPNETMIPVEFAETEGYMTIRALVDDESVRPEADAFLRGLKCATADEAAASGDGQPAD
ncbi:DUF1254 domain-containing protein [Aureimonas leprariae]|uniref:DUF1254 domain-containing protein n=1 Tax=Plantimonas leprariae TaxID=2615207 RepID=A0A7V7PPP1_9HYPH|nr:DUF1254 domain-containing protein [Aureimonas leprariae]KAB0679961.1 DUF1254 domain-containing protein [Aureimonas leprariae]